MGEFIWSMLWQSLAFLPLLVLFGFFPYLIFRGILPLHNKRWRRVILLLGLGLAAVMVIYVGDAFNILATLPALLIAVLVGASASLLEKGTMALLFFTLATSICGVADNIPYVRMSLLAIHAIRLTCWIGLWLFFRHMRRDATEIRLPARMWKLVLGLVAAPFMVMVAGISLAEFDAVSQTAMLVIMPFATLSCVALLTAILTLSRQAALEREQQMAVLNQTYYAQIERQQGEVRRLRHDMANQLQTLSAMQPSDVGPYLRQLLDSSAMRSGRRYSDNQVVNVVLTAKAAAMAEWRIAFDCVAPLPEMLPYAQTDLCAILCNALDNAMEACQPLPDASRWVELRAHAQKGLFVLCVKNPCLQTPQVKQGRLRTTKKDTALHGFGTQSVQAAAKKYGGTVQFNVADGQFELLLYMPLSTI